MAVYEFRCLNCKKKFSFSMSMSKFHPRKIKCPKCNSKKVEQRFTSVFAVTSKKS